MSADWKIRRYDAEAGTDADAVRRFACANANEKWTRDVERIIRRDIPDAAADGAISVFVADAGQHLVGVIAFGLDAKGVMVIHALAVVHDRRREGIGTALKLAALAECGSEGHATVASLVHRRNAAMLALNAKIGVAAERDPEDGEYMLSVARVELTGEEPG